MASTSIKQPIAARRVPMMCTSRWLLIVWTNRAPYNALAMPPQASPRISGARLDGDERNRRIPDDKCEAHCNHGHGKVERHGRLGIEADRIHENREPEFPAAEA